ncbi:MAG: cation diffusion facilitator family transporter [Clostridium sp.]|nr:cation diffusion facilitator family transporter [Clostridium sp.]MCM1208673.1 cation diffusion facilitator family transporter [Ruminococcus sp.]
MTDFLVKHFVKNYEQLDNPSVREHYGIFSSFVGIFCNVFLCVSKLLIGIMSGSISIISDGFNNLSDCASCVVTILGYKMAAKPADKDHPFGHGRIEYLTSLVIAVVIIVVGLELLKNSFDKLIHPTTLEFSYVALIVIIISIFVKIWMGLFNKRLGRRINSSIMLATSKDSMNDVATTSATLVALVGSLWTEFPLDAIMGILVSAFILISGFGIVKETVDLLLGRPVDEALVKRLEAIVGASEVSLGMHDLVIHSYGPGNMMGSAHIEVDCRKNIMDIHEAIDELEREIYNTLKINITIHMDPVDPGDELTNTCKQMVEQLVKSINDTLSIHDFRAVDCGGQTKLIFDMLIPYECSMHEDDIQKEIDSRLNTSEKNYVTVITYDKGGYTEVK